MQTRCGACSPGRVTFTRDQCVYTVTAINGTGVQRATYHVACQGAMILTIRHKGLRLYWERGLARGLNQDWLRRIDRLMNALEMSKRTPHPGEYILEECIRPLGLTVTEAAEGLGVTRNTLSRLINRRNGVSPEMAVRLSMAFGSTPEMWLRLQNAYDLAEARQKAGKLQVKRFVASQPGR